PEPPYDVTAWSLGMLLGVETVFVNNPLPAVKLTKLEGLPKPQGEIVGSGARFTFDYKGPDTAIAINRLLKEGARLAFEAPSRVSVAGLSRGKVERTPNPEPRTPNRWRAARARSTRRASRCINPGPAATWTKGGPAGCSSSTSST